jgi:pimeloyl-ACP methyl ester carboxylesterase
MGARAAIIYANTYPQRIEHVVIEDMHFIRRSGVQSVTGDEKFEQFYGSVDEVEHAVAVYALDRVWVERKLEEGQVRELNEVEKAAGMPNARYYVGTNPLVTRLQFKLLMCECDERTLTAFGGKARSTTRIVLAMASKNAACNRTSDLAAMKAAVRDLIVVTVPDSSHSIHGTQCDAFAKLLIEQLP